MKKNKRPSAAWVPAPTDEFVEVTSLWSRLAREGQILGAIWAGEARSREPFSPGRHGLGLHFGHVGHTSTAATARQTFGPGRPGLGSHFSRGAILYMWDMPLPRRDKQRDRGAQPLMVSTTDQPPAIWGGW